MDWDAAKGWGRFCDPLLAPFDEGWRSVVAVPLALGALAIAAWVVGWILTGLIGELLGVDDFFGYRFNKSNPGITPHLRFVGVGLVVLAVGWALESFLPPVLRERAEWQAIKRDLRAQRRADTESKNH